MFFIHIFFTYPYLSFIRLLAPKHFIHFYFCTCTCTIILPLCLYFHSHLAFFSCFFRANFTPHPPSIYYPTSPLCPTLPYPILSSPTLPCYLLQAVLDQEHREKQKLHDTIHQGKLYVSLDYYLYLLLLSKFISITSVSLIYYHHYCFHFRLFSVFPTSCIRLLFNFM